MIANNHRTRRSYRRVHGVVTRMYAHSFDMADRDGMTVHALFPDRLAMMAHGLGKGSVVDAYGLITHDGRQCVMRVERLERFTPGGKVTGRPFLQFLLQFLDQEE